MKVEFILQDPRLGTIGVRINRRSRSFTFRCVEGQFVCSSPSPYSEQALRHAIDELRPRLERMRERAATRQAFARFDASTRIDAELFHFWMQEAEVSSLRTRQRRGELVCFYPRHQNWDDQRTQDWLLHTIEESLRQHAQVILVPRLRELARQRGLQVGQVSIRKTKGRWGSCSGRGNISLSLYLMLLPVHLIDYVLHHELTHLLEMNHGPRFWALLDEACCGRARQLRAEMKNCDTSVFQKMKS